jgi:hypothetical protein
LATTTTIDAGGLLAETTVKLKLVTPSQLFVNGNSNVALTACSTYSQDVTVTNTGGRNDIHVRVALPGGSTAVASTSVFHTPKATSFALIWNGTGLCAAGSVAQSLNILLPIAIATRVGSVECGFHSPTTCEADPTVIVGTTIGDVFQDAHWNVQISPANCP